MLNLGQRCFIKYHPKKDMYTPQAFYQMVLDILQSKASMCTTDSTVKLVFHWWRNKKRSEAHILVRNKNNLCAKSKEKHHRQEYVILHHIGV